MRCGSSQSRESVIVVMDANRNRPDVSVLKWALNNVVRPRDLVIVLGVLCDVGKKSSCFPFYMGGRISAIWERLEFSTQPEIGTPQILQEEIARKKEEYQSNLQPFYRQCKKNEVKLEVKLAAGFCPRMITVEEGQNANARWIVLDSHWKKERYFIFRHVGCNVAVMKSSDIATIMPALLAECDLQKAMKIGDLNPVMFPENSLKEEELNPPQEEDGPPSPLSYPCWYPLSWRPGFPKAFTLTDIETITNNFAEENFALEVDNISYYKGVLLQTAVVVGCFTGDDQCWSSVKILRRVRHRNIANLVGYCCMDAANFQVYDWPCNGSLHSHLCGIDSSAKKLSWKVRWNIALDIGGCLRYLHEECADGPFVHLNVQVFNIVLSHNYRAMLSNFRYAKQIGDDNSGKSSMNGPLGNDNLVEDDLLYYDVKSYGVLLLELITGQSITSNDSHGFDQSLVDQTLLLLENGSLSQATDPRLTDSDEAVEVGSLAAAALLCLKPDSAHRPAMSEVLSVVRGDRFPTCKW